jgi:hypothetical protein
MEFTRRQIYDLVWSKPLSKIGREFKISDQKLAKVCRRLDIPVPPPGYWQKVAHGKQVEMPPLSTDRFDENVKTDIASATKSKTELKPGKLKTPIEKANPTVGQPVPAAHPVLLRIRKLFERGKKTDDFLNIDIEPFTIRASLPQAERVLGLLSYILESASRENWEIKKDGDAWRLFACGETVKIAVTEVTRKVPHIPTAAEIREAQKYSWHTIPQFDSEPSGDLKLSILNASYLGIRLNWADGKKQRLEEVLPSFIEGISIAGAALRSRRIERAEWERQAEVRRQEDARRRRLDEIQKTRLADLKQQARQHNEAELLRAYVDQVKQKPDALNAEDRQQVEAWIEWAEPSIEHLDPLGKGLPKLMSEDDAYSNSWRYRE